MDSFWTRDWTCEPALAGRFLSTGPPGESLKSISDITILQNSSFSDVSSIQFSHSVMSDSLRPHGLQHARPPCPSPTPRVYSNSCPLSRWCHPAISSSVAHFSSCPQSFPVSGSFQMSQLFTSGRQSIGVSASASVLPMNIQDWFPLGWTGLISLQSKGLSRVFQHHSSKASILWSSVHSLSWVNILVSLFFFW